MYGATLFLGINNATTVQPVVAIERMIFYRERAAGMYAAVPYAIAQVLRCLAHSVLFFSRDGTLPNNSFTTNPKMCHRMN